MVLIPTVSMGALNDTFSDLLSIIFCSEVTLLKLV